MGSPGRDNSGRNIYDSADSSRRTSAVTYISALRNNSGLKMAGVFICVGVIGAAVTELKAANTSSSSETKASSVEVKSDSHTSQQPPAPAPESPAQSADISTNVSSTTDSSGQPNTQVTVNGQPVDVPANGTRQQTVTSPDGSQTTVNISNSNQSTNGEASNSTDTSTRIRTHSSVEVTGGN
jgi:hypothetical protein